MSEVYRVQRSKSGNQYDVLKGNTLVCTIADKLEARNKAIDLNTELRKQPVSDTPSVEIQPEDF